MKNQKSFLTLAVIMMNLWVATGYASSLRENYLEEKDTMRPLSSPSGDQDGMIAPPGDQDGMIALQNSLNDSDEEDESSYVPSKDVVKWLKNNVRTVAKELQGKNIKWSDIKKYSLNSSNPQAMLPSLLNEDEDEDFILGGVKAQMALDEQAMGEVGASALDWLNEVGLSRSEEDNKKFKGFLQDAQKSQIISRILDVLPTAIQTATSQIVSVVDEIVNFLTKNNKINKVLQASDTLEAIFDVIEDINGPLGDDVLFEKFKAFSSAQQGLIAEKVVAQLKIDKFFSGGTFIQQLDRELRNSGKPLSSDMVNRAISKLSVSESMKEDLRNEFVNGRQNLDKILQELSAHRNRPMQVIKIIDIIDIAQESQELQNVSNFKEKHKALKQINDVNKFLKKALKQIKESPEDLTDKDGLADEFIKNFPELAKAMHQYVMDKSNKVNLDDLDDMQHDKMLHDLFTNSNGSIVPVTDDNRSDLAGIIKAIVGISENSKEDVQEQVKRVVDLVATLPNGKKNTSRSNQRSSQMRRIVDTSQMRRIVDTPRRDRGTNRG